MQSRASALIGTVATNNVQGGRYNRVNNYPVVTYRSTPKDVEGATPKIGSILALCSKNMIKKVNYDKFYEKLHTHIMNEYKNSDAIVEVSTNHSADITGDFENNNKSIELMDTEKNP